MTARKASQITEEALGLGLWPDRILEDVLEVVEKVAHLGGNRAIVPNVTGNIDLEDELKKKLRDLGFSCYVGDPHHLIIRW